MSKVFALLCTTAMVAGLITAATAQEEKKPAEKISIKDVMKRAHGSKLVDKVADEKASKEEREELLTLYLALAENKPPKGDETAWKVRTARLVAAAADAVEDPSDVRALKKAKDCKACHKEHKPPAES